MSPRGILLHPGQAGGGSRTYNFKTPPLKKLANPNLSARVKLSILKRLNQRFAGGECPIKEADFKDAMHFFENQQLEAQNSGNTALESESRAAFENVQLKISELTGADKVASESIIVETELVKVLEQTDSEEDALTAFERLLDLDSFDFPIRLQIAARRWLGNQNQEIQDSINALYQKLPYTNQILIGDEKEEINLFSDATFGSTFMGPERYDQEDALACFAVRGKKYFVVVDGMGGHAGGGEAARIALTETMIAIENGADLAGAIRIAHEAVLKFAREFAAEYKAKNGRDLETRPGAVMAAVRIEEDKARIVHAGDSLVYQAKQDGRVPLLTFPHSKLGDYVAEKLKIDDKTGTFGEDVIAEFEKMKKSPISTNVTQALGLNIERMRIKDIVLEEGDRLLMCSDGLDVLDFAKIKEIITRENGYTVEDLGRELAEAAEKSNPADNTTFFLVEREKIHELDEVEGKEIEIEIEADFLQQQELQKEAVELAKTTHWTPRARRKLALDLSGALSISHKEAQELIAGTETPAQAKQLIEIARQDPDRAGKVIQSAHRVIKLKDKAIAKLQEKITQLHESFEQKEKELEELRAQLGQAQGKVTVPDQRTKANYKERIRKLEELLEREQEKNKDLKVQLAEVEAGLKQTAVAEDEAAKDMKAELEDTKARLEHAQQTITKVKGQIRAKDKAIEDLKAAVDQAGQDRFSFNSHLAYIKHRRNELTKEHDELLETQAKVHERVVRKTLQAQQAIATLDREIAELGQVVKHRKQYYINEMGGAKEEVTREVLRAAMGEDALISKASAKLEALKTKREKLQTILPALEKSQEGIDAQLAAHKKEVAHFIRETMISPRNTLGQERQDTYTAWGAKNIDDLEKPPEDKTMEIPVLGVKEKGKPQNNGALGLEEKTVEILPRAVQIPPLAPLKEVTKTPQEIVNDAEALETAGDEAKKRLEEILQRHGAKNTLELQDRLRGEKDPEKIQDAKEAKELRKTITATGLQLPDIYKKYNVDNLAELKKKLLGTEGA